MTGIKNQQGLVSESSLPKKASISDLSKRQAALQQALSNVNAQNGAQQTQPEKAQQPAPVSRQPQEKAVANASPQAASNAQTTPAAPQSTTEGQGGQAQQTPSYVYDKNTDYSALIKQAAAAGNYPLAAYLEQQRNAKIDGEHSSYEKTHDYEKWLTGQTQQTQADGSAAPVYIYDNDTDYSALIARYIAEGNYGQAAILEQQRNAKIRGENLPYEQTNQYAAWLPGGANYVPGNYIQMTSQTSQNLNDLSPLINQLYDAADRQVRTSVNYETQGATDQLNRALQDAQPQYEAAIAQQLLETKQAQDAQALRNQVNGDRGGIGSAQVDSIINTGAKNREAISTQQRQLATDTARQIADLRAQGKYEEANLLLQNAQQRLSALYNEQVRLQQEEESRRETLASLGSTYLSSGLMPSEDMLNALGIDADTAQRYIDYIKSTAQSNTGSSGTGGGSAGGSGGGSAGGENAGSSKPLTSLSDGRLRQLLKVYESGGDSALADELSKYDGDVYDLEGAWNYVHENGTAPWWQKGIYTARQNDLIPPWWEIPGQSNG